MLGDQLRNVQGDTSVVLGLMKRSARKISCALTVVLCVLFASGCNNLIKPKSSSLTNLSFAPSLEFAGGNTMTLLTVLPSQHAPGVLYDMIGTSGQFDTYCGAAACSCEYTYSIPNIGQQSPVVTPVVYQESDLVRCANSVPSGVSTFSVRVLDSTGANATNSITVNLNAGSFSGSNAYLDLSNSQSYVMAKRYQCRRFAPIMNPMSPDMIDPLQAEDPRVIYPFNFYTTNVGESLLQLQRAGDQSWQCTLTPNQDLSLHWWSNPFVFSSNTCPLTDPFCAGDGELIYPTSAVESGIVPSAVLTHPGKRRASFSLAKQSYGVFQTAVKSRVAPQSYTNASYAVIGYGAKPIPSGNSSSCPNITLPANSRWVKLWNYRATDITAPKVVLGSNATTSTAIACNPGGAIFPSCAHDASFVEIGAAGNIVSRVVVPTSGNAAACYKFTIGTDSWLGSMYAFGDFTNPPSQSTIQGFPWGLYSDAVLNTTPPQELTTVNAHTPQDSNLVTQNLNSGENYTDNIYVVTDPNVDDAAMKASLSSVGHYRPITFRSMSDCNSNTRTGCPSNKEIHWDVNTAEIGGGDQFMYPLCVLQFYE